MARIRTIKPEFPSRKRLAGYRAMPACYSFNSGPLSTIGRARAASRMLASLLYPYDDDAEASSTVGWLNWSKKTAFAATGGWLALSRNC